MGEREGFSSHLGFILIAAGCAIGLGNVWRFPFITGQYGGAAFVIIYLLFLLIFGFPILVAEFSVGRASKKSIALSFDVLEKPHTKWHYAKFPMIASNYLLLMFYTTITGWMLYYFYRMVVTGDLFSMNPEQVSTEFELMLTNGPLLVFWMITATLIGIGIVSLGLRRGVEKVTKKMILLMFALLIILAIRAITLPGAEEGLKFYLFPDFQRLKEAGISSAIFAALGQSFFSLSLGIGAMSIFGSYIDKKHSLPKESIHVCALDTIVALLAGLIIFPSCFAFGVKPDAGPGLIFVTLPNVFTQMPAGRICGAVFFLIMAIAALSTLVATLENIVAFWIDWKGYKRKNVAKWNSIAIILLSLPCALGFSLFSDFKPFGANTSILDFEDFLLSNTFVPIGALVFILFCNHRYGFGQNNFFTEINTGKGIYIPANAITRVYFKWILPLLISFILVAGYLQKFTPHFFNKFFG